MNNLEFTPPMPLGRFFYYQVSDVHEGFQREIPYGLVRVQVY
ncbi:hypothetical protein [Umezakia ovalisporum]